MTVLRVVAVVILAFGACLFGAGTVFRSAANQNTEFVKGAQEKLGRNTDQTRATISRHATGYQIIGILSVASGIGLLLRQNWGRYLWLGITVFITGLELYAVWFGPLESSDFISLFVVLIVLIPLGFYFLKAKTKSFFQRKDAVV